MPHWRKAVPVLLTLSLSVSSLSFSQHGKKIDLGKLEGAWKGTGQLRMPVTNILVNISGQASFEYDSAQGYLRTALRGEKFLFSYSDSGHLVHDPQTDSISWEVWDNFGKRAMYHGTVEGNMIRGSRRHKSRLYSVMIALVTNDSIDFKLTVTGEDGASKDRAAFNLWRVEE